MTLKASPENYAVTEFAEFEVTVTLTDEVETPPPPALPPAAIPVVIESVTGPKSGELSSEGVTATFTNTTFTLKGAFDSMEIRALYYINKEDAQTVTTAFADLPTNYRAVYRYSPPGSKTHVIPFVVTLANHPDFTFNVTVTSNIRADIDELKPLIDRGVI